MLTLMPEPILRFAQDDSLPLPPARPPYRFALPINGAEVGGV